MITQTQIEELADFFRIDRFSVFREYLQLLFLNYLYQQKKASKIYFKGGTAIHLLLGSPRFSEDLDFSTAYNQKDTKEIVREVQKELQKELLAAKISLLYQGKKSIRFRLKYFLDQFKYPSAVRLDFQTEQKSEKAVVSPLITRFPLTLFPVISHLDPQAILAEKIIALLTRTKGRDVFDLWYLLEKGIKTNKLKFDGEILSKKVSNFPLRKLESDLKRFLPQPQRKIIKTLKSRLIGQLAIGRAFTLRETQLTDCKGSPSGIIIPYVIFSGVFAFN